MPENEDQKLLAALTIIELIMKYGVPAAISIITAWEVENPTVEDWEALKVKSADEYFKDSEAPADPAA